MKNDSGYTEKSGTLTPGSGQPMAPAGYGTDWGQVYPANGWDVPDNSASQYTGAQGSAAVVNRAGDGNDGDPQAGNTQLGLGVADGPASYTARGTGNNV